MPATPVGIVPAVVTEAGMALAPGSRLGPYEILAALGAGGMGEVYRARDTDVAPLSVASVRHAHHLLEDGHVQGKLVMTM